MLCLACNCGSLGAGHASSRMSTLANSSILQHQLKHASCEICLLHAPCRANIHRQKLGYILQAPSPAL